MTHSLEIHLLNSFGHFRSGKLYALQGHSHTTESDVIFDVSIRRGCRLAGGGLDASSRRHSRSSPDFR